MRTYVECVPCFFKQAIDVTTMLGVSARKQKEILDSLARKIPSYSMALTPPVMGMKIHDIVKKHLRIHDPYAKVKNSCTDRALAVYPAVKRMIARSPDRLLRAVELAIAGNIIDFGAFSTLDIGSALTGIMRDEVRCIKTEHKALFQYREFKAQVKRSRTILYIGDNAGETVFDRLLIEELQQFATQAIITYAVKERPIINDTTRVDAVRAGIGEVADIISTGVGAPGTVLALCSKRFLKQFRAADMVISKGQGNFEALTHARRPIFFLFMAKCPVVMRHVSSCIAPCRLNDIILYYYNS